MNAFNKWAPFPSQLISQYTTSWALLCVGFSGRSCFCQTSPSCLFPFVLVWTTGRCLGAAVFRSPHLLLLRCWLSSLGRSGSWAWHWSACPGFRSAFPGPGVCVCVCVSPCLGCVSVCVCFSLWLYFSNWILVIHLLANLPKIPIYFKFGWRKVVNVWLFLKKNLNNNKSQDLLSGASTVQTPL